MSQEGIPHEVQSPLAQAEQVINEAARMDAPVRADGPVGHPLEQADRVLADGYRTAVGEAITKAHDAISIHPAGKAVERLSNTRDHAISEERKYHLRAMHFGNTAGRGFGLRNPSAWARRREGDFNDASPHLDGPNP